MELDYVALGEHIRQRRKAQGITQVQLAEQVDLEPSNISHIEWEVVKSQTWLTGEDYKLPRLHNGGSAYLKAASVNFIFF